jgi:hypothetical protein
MKHSDQGIVKDEKGQEQPADKRRAQTVHSTQPGHSVSREAIRDSAHSDAPATPGKPKDQK